jgi:hypothetical protein
VETRVLVPTLAQAETVGSLELEKVEYLAGAERQPILASAGNQDARVGRGGVGSDKVASLAGLGQAA